MASDEKDVSGTTEELFTHLSNEQLLAQLSYRVDHLRARLRDLEATGMCLMLFPPSRRNGKNENDRAWVEIFVEEVGKMLDKANDLEFSANK